MVISAAAGKGYRRGVPHLRPTLAGFGSWIGERPEESFPTCHPLVNKVELRQVKRPIYVAEISEIMSIS